MPDLHCTCSVTVVLAGVHLDVLFVCLRGAGHVCVLWLPHQVQGRWSCIWPASHAMEHLHMQLRDMCKPWSLQASSLGVASPTAGGGDGQSHAGAVHP
jgi:hypothetical protein